MRHIADTDINLLHPDDHPPPHGVKMLLYMHPHGTLAIGQWQHSGASLWAPMPSVGQDMKARLEAEFEAKTRQTDGVGRMNWRRNCVNLPHNAGVTGAELAKRPR